jgi:hypothetical protein
MKKHSQLIHMNLTSAGSDDVSGRTGQPWKSGLVETSGKNQKGVTGRERGVYRFIARKLTGQSFRPYHSDAEVA